jgi:signal transduction histidine kinase/putative methionine-R-sulfoxide reductase with GAF domain
MAHEAPPSTSIAPQATEGDDSLRQLAARLRAEERKLALVQEIGRALAQSLDLDQLLGLIMEKITLLMEADRSTLYLLGDDGKELWSKVLQGGEVLEIRLNVGEGIAGWVAQSGETVNIPDAYADKRFQPAVDLKSGYRTRSILCMPMRNSLGAIIGVVQVLNKQDGPFTDEDEQLLAALAAQAAVSIENAKLYQSVVVKNVELLTAQERLKQRTFELNVLFEIEKEVSAAHDLDELLERILHRTLGMVGAEAGSIALSDTEGKRLIFRTTAGDTAEDVGARSIDMGVGVIGWVAAHREPLISNSPHTDPRHAAEYADAIGRQPRNIACAPLVTTDAVLGAIEVLDKQPHPDHQEAPLGFTEGDLKLLVLIAGQASKAIQLARGKREREHQNRLATIGQMLAGVLHDLKTPMTIISGYAQLMAQIDDPAERESYVDQILRQFDLMSGMTKEVLQFARGQTSVLMRKVYLHKFLDEVVGQLHHDLAGRGVTVELTADYRGVAYFDEQKIVRLIHNLARNAAQAMKGRGKFHIHCFADDDWIHLEFADTGPGIPKEMEGRLFELFASGDEGGTGLGLAIVKKIVDEHGGAISYRSERGKGATFRVRLPREKPDGVRAETVE